MNQNSALYWFPLIKDLLIPMSKTVIIEANEEEIKSYYHCEGDAPRLDRIKEEKRRITDYPRTQP